VATAERAGALASEGGNQALGDRIRQLLELYRKRQPCHQPAQ